MSTRAGQTVSATRTTRRFSTNVWVWIGLVAYLGFAKIILDTFLPQAFADPAQAAQFRWLNLGIFSVVGLIGVLLAEKTGFPDAYVPGQFLWQRLVVPIAVGLVLGVVLVLIDLPTRFTALFAANHGVTQQYTDFPSMFFIFTSAAIIVETVYRLFIIPILLWLISSLILKGRAQTTIFWILAVLTSLLEPLGQSVDLMTLPGPLALSLGGIYFGVNLIQAGFFRKVGFLAAILVRVGFYLVWHVLYIH